LIELRARAILLPQRIHLAACDPEESMLVRVPLGLVPTALAGLLLLAVPPREAFGQTLDQYHSGFTPSGWYSILTEYGQGQSFRPALDHVDFVRLAISATGLPAHQVTFVVDLHAGSPTTARIATSEPVVIGGGGPDVRTFSFAAPVPVVPGDPYCLMIRMTAGTSNFFLGIGGDGYPLGQLISRWAPDAYRLDAWFEEGVLEVPAESGTWGRIKHTYR
jgi:hypothetical protein